MTGAGGGGIISPRAVALSGFGGFEAAARFCTAPDELRAYFRSRRTMGEGPSLAEQREMFRDRWSALLRLIAA